MSTAWFSLRRRLLVVLLGGVSACWLVMMVWSFIDAHHEIDKLFDAQLAQSAQVLLAITDKYDDPMDDRLEDTGKFGHKYQRRLRFQIWGEDGQILLRSGNAPETPLADEDGFSEFWSVKDGWWRNYRQWDTEHKRQVQVSENHQVRDKLIGHIAWRLLLPALFGLPLLGLWIWLGTRQSLAALDGVASQIAARAPEQLQPVTPARAPEEIRPLVDALNGLLGRVDSALEAERRFTADAAHELRTPLAGLQAQLQVALRARDDAERDASLENIRAGLGRAAHLVEQMLLLARLDPEKGLPAPETVDLANLAEEVCADLGAQILARQQDFALTATPVAVTGQREWLRVLIRNLVDNAVRYTPRGGKLRVEVGQQQGLPTLTVADSGPGIAAQEREQVLHRFHRLASEGVTGSGLGLSIVLRIAELHQAVLILDDSPGIGGLAARVQFPGKPHKSKPGKSISDADDADLHR